MIFFEGGPTPQPPGMENLSEEHWLHRGWRGGRGGGAGTSPLGGKGRNDLEEGD